MSIELSIKMLLAADNTQESLKLLSLCSMLPDGLRHDVFEKLRAHFHCIDLARDTLFVYALISVESDCTLRTLSPIRHFVLDRHPAKPNHRDTLFSIYFEIADQLPTDMDERFKERAIVAAPEIGNLSSLLIMLVNHPSQQVVDAVDKLTQFSSHRQPSLTVALALLPHVEPYPEWKATCTKLIGTTHVALDNYRDAIACFSNATQLFLQAQNLSEAAWCKRAAASPHRLLAETDQAELLLSEAHHIYATLSDMFGEAMCRMDLGHLMRAKNDYPAAIEHLTAARQTFTTLQKPFLASRCLELRGIVYLDQDNFDSAVAELDAARSVYVILGAQTNVAQCMRFIGITRRRQGELLLAEKLLLEAESMYADGSDRLGLASCALQLGYLRRDQGRSEQATTLYKSALRVFEDLNLELEVQICRKLIESVNLTVPTDTNSS